MPCLFGYVSYAVPFMLSCFLFLFLSWKLFSFVNVLDFVPLSFCSYVTHTHTTSHFLKYHSKPGICFTFSAGDQVLIKPSKKNDLLYVGSVKKILLGTSTSDTQVTVTWFYRPKPPVTPIRSSMIRRSSYTLQRHNHIMLKPL